MPDTSAKIFTAFGGETRALEACKTFGARESVTVTAIPPLFARIDFKTLAPEIEKIREAQLASLAPAKPEEKKEESMQKEQITFEDFEKVQLRVGEIIACEAVPKSSKLLKETVKFGDEIRTIVSGIAKHYKPEEMVGKKVVFVTNLAPRKICGIESQGMILGAEDENGAFSLIVPEKDVQSGTDLG